MKRSTLADIREALRAYVTTRTWREIFEGSEELLQSIDRVPEFTPANKKQANRFINYLDGVTTRNGSSALVVFIRALAQQFEPLSDARNELEELLVKLDLEEMPVTVSQSIDRAIDRATEARADITTIILETPRSLTKTYLADTVVPYLGAIGEIQRIMDMARRLPFSRVIRIRSISQNSPLSISFEGVSDAIRALQELFVPWRRKYAREIAALEVEEKRIDIEKKKIDLLEARVNIEKGNAAIQQIKAEAERLREETFTLTLENERKVLELRKSQIDVAAEVMISIAPNLSEKEKIVHIATLLPPLHTITISELLLTDERRPRKSR